MWNVFESYWLLLTIAGIALIVVSMLRMDHPEWGRKPLLIPLVLAALAFGLDAGFKSDSEYLRYIVTTAKNAAADNDVRTMMQFISPNYSDVRHKSRNHLDSSMKYYLGKAAIEKIKTQSHVLTLDSKTAASSEWNFVLHLDQDSQYSAAGQIVFIGMKFEFEKIGKKWFIKRAELISVNGDRMGWGSVP